MISLGAYAFHTKMFMFFVQSLSISDHVPSSSVSHPLIFIPLILFLLSHKDGFFFFSPYSEISDARAGSYGKVCVLRLWTVDSGADSKIIWFRYIWRHTAQYWGQITVSAFLSFGSEGCFRIGESINWMCFCLFLFCFEKILQIPGAVSTEEECQ